MKQFPVFAWRGAVGACILLGACAAVDPPPVAPDNAYGAFLAARYADSQNDPAAATGFYAAALRADPGNRVLVAEGFLAALLAGSPQAGALAEQVPDNALAEMLRGNQAALDGDFGQAAAAYGALPQDDLAGLIKPVLLAWARFGQGDAAGAVAGLRPLFNDARFGTVFLLNAALIADAAHDQMGAAALYAQVDGEGPNLRLAEILASWDARSGQPAAAAQELAALVAAHPDLAVALAGLRAQVQAPVIATPAQGLAEAYLTLAGSLGQPQQGFLRTTFLRFALGLRPDLTAARLLLASVQAGGSAPTQAQLAQALATLQPIGPSDALYAPAALQEADLLAALNRPQEAVALLDQLIAANPENPDLLAQAGDVLRNTGNYDGAVGYYDRALAAAGQPAPAGAWTLYFDRGICEDETGHWEAAQADMQAALGLSPNQPYVLNYLAYSWALRGERLDEAHDMLQEAVGLDPNDGAVIDSLGYVDLRQGHTKAAMALLTQAVELDPDDAEVNAHLGDAFWQAGEKLQADYQWQRALALKPDAKLRAQIDGKIKQFFSAPA
jgi:tetratricopeptide (TPR) repeat protein